MRSTRSGLFRFAALEVAQLRYLATLPLGVVFFCSFSCDLLLKMSYYSYPSVIYVNHLVHLQFRVHVFPFRHVFQCNFVWVVLHNNCCELDDTVEAYWMKWAQFRQNRYCRSKSQPPNRVLTSDLFPSLPSDCLGGRKQREARPNEQREGVHWSKNEVGRRAKVWPDSGSACLNTLGCIVCRGRTDVR